MTHRTHATPHRVRHAIATGALVTAGALVLASCASPGASAGGASGPSIVATTTQVGDFTRELVGDTADVTQLINSGQSAHGFDPSAAQLVALAEADALVVNGAGLESWLDDAVAASGFDGVLIDASTGIELFGTDDHADEAHSDEAHSDEAHSDEVHGDAAHPEEHADHADDEPTDDHDEHDDHDDHATDDHAGHDHGDGNPHIWTDPHLAEHMVENIGTGLATVPGLDADAIATNEDESFDQLAALDGWIHENVERVPAEQRLLVTNHDAFTYFLEAYDITFVGSVIPSFDDNAEPSAADIDELVAKIRATGVQAVFSEASISPKAAETIARDADVKVYAGDDALYGDSLGPDGSDGATYLGSQEHNVRLILESWGVEPSHSRHCCKDDRMPLSDSPVLRLSGAAFTHPGGGGVGGLDLTVEAGSALALIGPNGAGKSTLLKGVLGLVPLTAGTMELGSVEVGGADAATAAPTPSHSRNGMIGFLPQSSELDPDFPISLEQVVMQGRYRKLGLMRWPGRADRAAVRRALDTVGLTTLAKRRFGELSGGQRQRGLLARALASEPRLLLLDEPFNGLDQTNRDALVDTLRALKKQGVAVIVSTHDLELAKEVCDVVALVNGTQLAFGAVDEVLTLGNVQECFDGVEVELDEHTLVVPGHEGH